MADDDQQLKEPSHPQEDWGSSRPMTMVGIGVGVLSLRSLALLFSGIDPDLGAAYFVAVRQQEGLDVHSVVQALKQLELLPVKIATNGERPAANEIIVCGPDDMLTIEDDHIVVRPAPASQRGVVDTMLVSLAEHAHDRAIAVILSGLGSDGTAGVTATKKFGGLSIAELVEGKDETFREGAGPFGAVDLRLQTREIPEHIALYTRNLAKDAETGDSERAAADLDARIGQITAVLRKVTGHDFHGYKRGTFARRVRRRMQVLQIGSVDAYIQRMRANREEVQSLFQDLLIGVTQFFRDPAEFDVLEREIPRLFAGKGLGDRLRVWVLGCATGEEAYSIAILLREHMATLDQPPEVQIFATDLDARALGLARAGRYSVTIGNHIRPDRLARWFFREGDTYCVARELREMCIFSPHNIVKDAPFSRIDILSCRNLLIYLNLELQNRVIPIFHFALRPSGVLFLGSSENVTRHAKLFAPIDRKSRVFRRLETATRIIPDFSLSPRVRGSDLQEMARPPAPATGRLSDTISRQAEAVADRFAPAYVVVDREADVLHFSGRTGRYFDPAPGIASLNLLTLVHRDLRQELRPALHRAIAEDASIEVPRVLLKQDDRTYAVNLFVEPLGKGEITSLIVVFQDAGQVADEAATGGDRSATDEHVQRLETDLRVTRDRLQAFIEELESTNEELKSSNEEYQSINEELQSASEEMETSKEELQSVNEELQTVNGELAHRVSDLGRSNSDLKNLLEATQIATIFVDNDLRVRNFTPAATAVFHLLENDVGRPLDHVVSRVGYPELQDDVRQVLKTLVAVDRQVSNAAADRHFAARVLPYRSVDNFISGAVVTFTDLTATYKAEEALRKSEQRLQRVIETDAVGLIFFDHAGVVVNANDVFLKLSGYTRSQIERRELDLRRLTPREHIAAVDAQLQALESTGRLAPNEKEYVLADGTRRWMLSTGRDLGDGTIVEFCIDVSARRRAEAAFRASEEQFRLFGEASSDVLWIRDAETLRWVYLTRAFEVIYGVGREQAISGDELGDWTELIIPEDRARVIEQTRRVRQGESSEFEYRIKRQTDGQIRWVRNTDFPLFGLDGEVRQIGGIARDITETRATAERLEVLVAELQHRTRNLMSVVRSMADKTARSSNDLGDFRKRFFDRLDALARVQGLLSRLNEGDRVTFDELLRTELSAHGVQDDASSMTLRGPAGVRLRSATVQTLALALHELATNAAKYGALRQPAARLSISWRVTEADGDGGPWLHIDWQESGVSMAAQDDGPQGGGHGRELIERALPYQLDAKTTYIVGDDGVRCSIAIPVAEGNLLDGERQDRTSP